MRIIKIAVLVAVAFTVPTQAEETLYTKLKQKACVKDYKARGKTNPAASCVVDSQQTCLVRCRPEARKKWPKRAKQCKVICK